MDRQHITTPGIARAVNTRTRRDVIAAAGFTVLAGIAVAGFCRPDQPASLDETLIGLCAQADALEHQYVAYIRSLGDDVPEDDEILDAIWEQQNPILTQISQTPANTLDGMRAKARTLVLWAEDVLQPPGDADPIQALTSSVLRDLVEG